MDLQGSYFEGLSIGDLEIDVFLSFGRSGMAESIPITD